MGCCVVWVSSHHKGTFSLQFSEVSGTSGQKNLRFGGGTCDLGTMWTCDLGTWDPWFQWFCSCFDMEPSNVVNDLIPYWHGIIYLAIYLQYLIYRISFSKSFTGKTCGWRLRMADQHPAAPLNGSGLPGLAKTIIFKAPLGSTDCSRPFRCEGSEMSEV